MVFRTVFRSHFFVGSEVRFFSFSPATDCRGDRISSKHLFLQAVRGCSHNSTPRGKWKNKLHIYSYSMNWNSGMELARFLERNVIFNQNGLVVVNKPYGVGKQQPIINKNKLKSIEKLNTAVVGEDYYLDDLLPTLARLCGYETLESVKIPERFTSGVTILSSSEELTFHVKECIRLGKAQGKILDKYWLVCLNEPHPPSSQSKFAVQYETDKVSNTSKPYLTTSWSKNAVKRGEAVPVSVEHTTLCASNFASLVEVVPSRTKAHFLRLYMCHMLSPILGDNLYGSLVQKIKGVPVLVNPFSQIAQRPPRLDDSLLSILALQKANEVFIPTHSHLREVTIPDFHGKGNPLVLEAPVPEFFDWTCKRLLLKETLLDKVSEMKC